ncbi:hypothetical protein [uncultured Gammaproteobacteria bacterium]|nr:hypothetical protein [uncultured Gammaproteobacteria bacterium]
MSLILSLTVIYSPPHRWLRKVKVETEVISIYSPPHRWLRKQPNPQPQPDPHSPPHRWLRNLLCFFIKV